MEKKTLKIILLLLNTLSVSIAQTTLLAPADAIQQKVSDSTLSPKMFQDLHSCKSYVPKLQTYIDGLKAYAKSDPVSDKGHQDYYQAQIEYYEALKNACATGKKPAHILPIIHQFLYDLWKLLEKNCFLNENSIEIVARSYNLWPTQNNTPPINLAAQQRILERFFLEEYLVHIFQKSLPPPLLALRRNITRYLLLRLSWRQHAELRKLDSTLFPKIQAEEATIYKKATQALNTLAEISLDFSTPHTTQEHATILDPAHILGA